jgi:hypothetical protein
VIDPLAESNIPDDVVDPIAELNNPDDTGSGISMCGDNTSDFIAAIEHDSLLRLLAQKEQKIENFKKQLKNSKKLVFFYRRKCSSEVKKIMGQPMMQMMIQDHHWSSSKLYQLQSTRQFHWTTDLSNMAKCKKAN